MRLLPLCLSLLLAVSLLPLQAQAAKKKTNAKESSLENVVAPADVADAFHEALRTRNRDQAAAILAPTALLFETGYAESTRDDYVKNHFSDDSEFASATDYTVLHRSVFVGGHSAWVLTQSNIQGIFGDQRVNLDQTETMILRFENNAWQIVHLHWSAHPHQINDAEPAAQAVPPATDAKSSAQPTVPSQSEAKPEDAK